MKFRNMIFYKEDGAGGGEGGDGGGVGTMNDFIVNPEGNFASDWRDSLDDGVRGSLEGINNFNEMVSQIHEYKTKPPTTIAGLADEKGVLKEGWHEQYEELKDNASMKNFKSVEGLAKSLVNANKMVGKKLAPGEFISDEHKKEFYQSLGVPEKAEDYGMAKPEGHPDDMPYDQTQVDWFANKALEYNLTPDQAQGLRNDFYQLQKASWENGTSELNGNIEAENKKLQELWGAKDEHNREMATLALEKIGILDVADKYGLTKSADFIAAMHELSQTMGEDTLVTVGQGEAADTIENIKGKVAELQAHPGFLDPGHPEYQNIQRKITGYFKQMYPEGKK